MHCGARIGFLTLGEIWSLQFSDPTWISECFAACIPHHPHCSYAPPSAPFLKPTLPFLIYSTSTPAGQWPILLMMSVPPLVTIFIGICIQKEMVTPTRFPYYSSACALISVIGFVMPLVLMVRFGALSGNSPWDGQARLAISVLLLLLPR